MKWVLILTVWQIESRMGKRHGNVSIKMHPSRAKPKYLINSKKEIRNYELQQTIRKPNMLFALGGRGFEVLCFNCRSCFLHLTFIF